MERNIKENGKTTKCLDMAKCNLKMVKNTLVILLIMLGMEEV